jgi:hypothetical protein
VGVTVGFGVRVAVGVGLGEGGAQPPSINIPRISIVAAICHALLFRFGIIGVIPCLFQMIVWFARLWALPV